MEQPPEVVARICIVRAGRGRDAPGIDAAEDDPQPGREHVWDRASHSTRIGDRDPAGCRAQPGWRHPFPQPGSGAPRTRNRAGRAQQPPRTVRHARPKFAAEGPMRGRVLVVDDDSLIRQVAERSLTRAGFEVATAATTWQARFLSATELFDVAILDYFLEPGERGCDSHPRASGAQPGDPHRRGERPGRPARSGPLRARGWRRRSWPARSSVNWAALAGGEPSPPAVPPRPVVNLDALRREAIHGTLLVHRRNISDTARALGMTRSSLQRVLRKMPLPVLDDEATRQRAASSGAPCRIRRHPPPLHTAFPDDSRSGRSRHAASL